MKIPFFMIKAQTRIFIYICWMIFNELRKAFLLFDCEEIFQISGWLLEKSISLLFYFHVYMWRLSSPRFDSIYRKWFNIYVQYLLKLLTCMHIFKIPQILFQEFLDSFFCVSFFFWLIFLWKKKHKKVLFLANIGEVFDFILHTFSSPFLHKKIYSSSQNDDGGGRKRQ